MLFLLTVMIKFSFNKSSGSKCHAVEFTAPIFAGFCMSHRSQWGGGADGLGLCWEKLGGCE